MSTKPDRSKVIENIEQYLRILEASKETLADAVVEQGSGLVVQVADDRLAPSGCHVKGIGGHCKL